MQKIEKLLMRRGITTTSSLHTHENLKGHKLCCCPCCCYTFTFHYLCDNLLTNHIYLGF